MKVELPPPTSSIKQHGLSSQKGYLSRQAFAAIFRHMRRNFEVKKKRNCLNFYEKVKPMLEILQYYGAASGVIAALMIAMNLGERWTGIAFVIFVTSSISLILWGFLQDDAGGIGMQNIALLVINAFGVYRHLFARRDSAPGA